VPAIAPAARVQLVAGVKVPVELLVKLTVPVGVVGDEEVSVTVTVHDVGVLTCTEAGEHWTVVVVGCGGTAVTARLNEPLLVV